MAKKEKKSQELKPVKLSAIDEDVLTVLKVQGEQYGLEILDCLNLDREKILGIELGFGSLYPALNRLEKKGLIEWRWGDESEVSGGARRKYYKINALGLQSLDAVQRYRVKLINANSV
ncbi:MAG: PadR family transcriptional regulator [Xenococcus sp. (in: cyanobacteria)]